MQFCASARKSTSKASKLLTFVPTPIGNLQDISLRALNALTSASVVLCEDSRVAKKLYLLLLEKGFFAFQNSQTISKEQILNKQFISVHSHNEAEFLKTITTTQNTESKQEKEQDFFSQNVIFISDAGMPCINDPGAKIVNFCIQNNIDFEILPGASALTASFASFGVDNSEFYFGGFLPPKKEARREKIANIKSINATCIFYESPHRILECISDFAQILPNAKMLCHKEISKIFERKFYGTPSEILSQLESANTQGEWCICVLDSEKANTQNLSIEFLNSLDMPPKTRAKIYAKLTGKTPKECYENILDSQK